MCRRPWLGVGGACQPRAESGGSARGGGSAPRFSASRDLQANPSRLSLALLFRLFTACSLRSSRPATSCAERPTTWRSRSACRCAGRERGKRIHEDTCAQRTVLVDRSIVFAELCRDCHPATAKLVMSGISRYAEQPCLERRLPRHVAVEPGQELQERVLGDVLGGFSITEQAGHEALDGRRIPRIEETNCLFVPCFRAKNDPTDNRLVVSRSLSPVSLPQLINDPKRRRNGWVGQTIEPLQGERHLTLLGGAGLSGRAGLPTTTACGATSLVTTAPAPTRAPSPIRTPHRIVAPEPSGGAALDDRVLEEPFGIVEQLSARVAGPRPPVVDEDDAVADEDLVMDLDPVADERVALDLAVRAHRRAALDLHEGADPELSPIGSRRGW